MNSVGVDAVVQPTAVRCVAGGYVWNPFYTQLADPLNVSGCIRETLEKKLNNFLFDLDRFVSRGMRCR